MTHPCFDLMEADAEPVGATFSTLGADIFILKHCVTL